MKVYIVFAKYLYEQEILAVCGTSDMADSWRQTEQENFRASGDYAKIVVEEWEVE